MTDEDDDLIAGLCRRIDHKEVVTVRIKEKQLADHLGFRGYRLRGFIEHVGTLDDEVELTFEREVTT